MYVCICSAVTDRQIRRCVEEGACSIKELRECLGVAKQCGRCAPFAKSLLKELTAPPVELPHLALGAA